MINEAQLHKASHLADVQWHQLQDLQAEPNIQAAASALRDLESEMQERAASILASNGLSDWHVSLSLSSTRRG